MTTETIRPRSVVGMVCGGTLLISPSQIRSSAERFRDFILYNYSNLDYKENRNNKRYMDGFGFLRMLEYLFTFHLELEAPPSACSLLGI